MIGLSSIGGITAKSRNLFLANAGDRHFSQFNPPRETGPEVPASRHSNPTMNQKRILPLFACILVAACSSKEEAEKAAEAAPTPTELLAGKPEVHGPEIKSVEITTPLNQEWVAKGKTTYEMKCLPCHKLTADKLVGPGWLGVTKRRQPVWIMNMVTNVDMMLEKDAEAQKLLEQCLVRMPNQNLTAEETRQVLEFMRNNDGEK